ncbi:surfeit locus protein 1 [Cinnamomum micranthum f. kanehirae]|uniref:SURF1-like protein n=1 Tax=Cinnamomum micranthum f. kanehirae TaxID=337451 RepID=A0A3S3NYY8_9MAGN|nr:surfeit locus protein 1 [Cinnamomum micranthum f. kanehirae]
MAPFLTKALRKTHNIDIAFIANPTRNNPISRSPISPLSSFCRNLSSLPLSSSPSSQAQAQAQGCFSLDLCNLFLGFYTDPERQGKRWSRWLLFLPGAVTFGLGTWQIFRRQQKIEMIEYRKKRLDMEPIALNSISPSDGDLTSSEFRRVVCEGVFDETKSIFIGPRSRSISGVTENGYYVVTPLMLSLNKPDSYLFIENCLVSAQLSVLVNRGWVPRSWRNKPSEDLRDVEKSSTVASQNIEEKERSFWRRLWPKKPKAIMDEKPAVTPVKVIGVVRESEKPSIFVPANDPSSGQWFYVDVPAIARSAGLPENTIYIEDTNEDISASQPYPIPKDVNTLIRYSVMPQDHLNYTLTWYSLSAAVTFMAFKRLNPKKSRR